MTAFGSLLGRILARLRERAFRGRPAHLRAGLRGEDAAYNHVREQGYRVIARNYRSRKGRGEIDLVAWDGDELVFIEVKTRKNEDFGTAMEAVDREKRRHLIRTAREYVRRSKLDEAPARFDVVSVITEPQQRVTLSKNAFPGGFARVAGGSL